MFMNVTLLVIFINEDLNMLIFNNECDKFVKAICALLNVRIQMILLVYVYCIGT